MTRLEAADVPFAPIQTIPEVIDDPQVAHLDTFYEEQHPTEGRNLGIYRPVLIDGKRDTVPPAPTLGEHTDAVLTDLGYGADDIERLRAASVV